MIKIVVDAYGGDNSPLANVQGAVNALNGIKDLEIVLVGNQPTLEQLLAEERYDKKRLSILHAPDVISCNDKPVDAIRTKKDSSMAKSFELMRNDPDARAMVSLGSSGALLAGATLKIGRIRGIKRPAFCPVLPTMTGGLVAICDSGANVDCEPTHLQQFAIMGSLYMQKAYGVKNPRVALLNIGVEEEKGDALRKEVYPLLESTESVNFVGNMESRNLLSGEFDLIVCDGFSGNVLLKSTEGACTLLMKLIKKTLMGTTRSKMGLLLAKKQLYKVKDLMDVGNHGGAVILGTTKTVVKGHGNAEANTVCNCIKQAYNMETHDLCKAIGEEVTKLAETQNALD
ncbi:MAG: phosphate acyltransferase PlsX [Corallococcus sp.]|nr:phosphate acyltransferase PlsX [Corallococcus sp.]MCM1360078.1 phosphate acyltransferase PlsX [Corallococcus sp.]MCM1395635.1 phosphate acyltransferase PlsX [Corallococcus sp.]